MRTFLFRAVLSATVCAVLSAAAGCSGQSDTAKKPASTADTARSSTAQDSVLVELTGRDSVSVFDLLRQSHAVCFQESMGGVFVKQIDSAKNSASAFWIYSVNDTMPKVAADRLLTRTGDRVKWHFRKVSG